MIYVTAWLRALAVVLAIGGLALFSYCSAKRSWPIITVLAALISAAGFILLSTIDDFFPQV